MSEQYSGTDNLEVMAEAANYNEFLLNLIYRDINDGSEVLDFGAGIGTFANKLRDLNCCVACVEPDPEQFQILKNNNFSVYRDLQDVRSGSLDFIYSLNVLEHIDDDLAALRGLYEKLKPDGKALIYVPALQFLYSSMDQKVGHYRRYSLRKLVELAKEAGFSVKRAQYVDSLGVLATLLYKIAGGKDGSINIHALRIYDQFVFPVSRFFDHIFGKVAGKNVYIVVEKG